MSYGLGHQLYGSLQGHPETQFISTGLATLIHYFLANYLARTLDLRMQGIAIATLVHFAARLFFSATYCRLNSDLKRGIIPLRHEDSFKELGYIAKVGWESFRLKVMGWWAFDVFTQLSALPPNTDADLAAQTILRNIGLYTYMIPVGLASASNFFTGKYIGANMVEQARKISTLCMVSAFIWSIGTMLLVGVFQKSIIDFYTSEKAVQDSIKTAWYVLIMFILCDCMQGVSAGLISGLSLLSKVKNITLINYWAIGIPISIYLMFSLNMGLAGLWYGPTVACALNFSFYQYNILKADWQALADGIIAKMESQNANLK